MMQFFLFKHIQIILKDLRFLIAFVELMAGWRDRHDGELNWLSILFEHARVFRMTQKIR